MSEKKGAPRFEGEEEVDGGSEFEGEKRDKAMPGIPGARWDSGDMALNKCVVRLAPFSTASQACSYVASLVVSK